MLVTMQRRMMASLDLLRIRVRREKLVTKQLMLEDTSPSSTSLALLSMLAPMQLAMEDSLTGSTRLVLLIMLVTGQLNLVDPLTVPGSARLVLPLLPAMELHTPLIWLKMASHLDPKSLRVSRTVYVIHVQVYLMMQVSLTSVVTNWTLLEICWTS